MPNATAIEKYLQRYAEAEALQAQALLARVALPARGTLSARGTSSARAAAHQSAQYSYQHCLCIPAYDESADFLQRLAALATAQPGNLYIVVVNQPDSVSAPTTANLRLLAIIDERYPVAAHANNMQLHALNSHSDLLVVDRCASGNQLAASAGVGLARKIAADIALQLIVDGLIQQPFIFCSDADAYWPDNYFRAADTRAAAAATRPAALLYPFRHVDAGGNSGATLCAATRLYERRINAYVAGLQFAGSAYAYHTLGSTLCVSARHYAMVRGFPRRAAGEDFYILNKLRKTGPVLVLEHPIIALAMRASQRTPFGTGPAVAALAALPDKLSTEPAIFYHPQLFVYLRSLLRWFTRLGQTQSPPEWREHLLTFLHSDARSAQFAGQYPLDNDPNEYGALIIAGLEAIGFAGGLAHCQQQASDAASFGKHLFCWFDAFKTLKWLHQLRAAQASLGNIGETEMAAAWLRIKNGAAD